MSAGVRSGTPYRNVPRGAGSAAHSVCVAQKTGVDLGLFG